MFLPQADAKTALMFGWLGDTVLVQPFRLGLMAVTKALGLGTPRGVGVPPMSQEWLREHATDFDKHGRAY